MGKPPPPAARPSKDLIMMPRKDTATRCCAALGVALLLSVYPLWGVARGDADDGIGRGSHGCCLSAWRARFRAGARLCG